MSDFQIKLNVHVDGSKAETELNDLIEKLENKKINIKFNVKDLQTQLNNLKTALNDAFRLDNTQLANLKQIKEVLTEINKLSSDVQKNLFGGGTSNIDKTRSSLSSLEKQIESIKSKTNNLLKFDGFLGSDASKAENLIKRLEIINRLIQETKEKMANGTINTSDAQAKIEQLTKRTELLKTKLAELQEISKTNKLTFKRDNSIETITNQIEKLKQKCIDLGVSTSALEKFEQELANIKNLPLNEQITRLSALKSKITQYGQSLPKATKNTRALGNAMRSTNSFCGNLYSSLMMFSAGNIIAMQLTKAVSAIKDTIIDLDSAFRDLMKVAPDSFQGTTDQLDALRQKASEVGQDVARSSVDIINSTASALQAGFKDVDKAMEYAKNVNMFANVADISESQSDEYIKSIASAYGGVANSLDEVKDSVTGAGKGYSVLTDMLDQFNYVG